MNVKIYLYLAASLTLLPLAAATAQSPTPSSATSAAAADAQNHELRREPPRVNLFVAAMDTDKDGRISVAEIAASGATLKTLDKNNDGVITPDELRPKPSPVVIPTAEIVGRLLEFDRSGDGKLTVAELPARMKPLLSQADINKDGILSTVELTAHVEKQEAIRVKAEQEAAAKRQAEIQANPALAEPRREGPGGAGSEGMRRGGIGGGASSGVSGPGGIGGPGGMRMNPLLTALDTDKDGTVSASEISTAPVTLKTLDKNNDGILTADELRPAGFGEGRPGGPGSPDGSGGPNRELRGEDGVRP